MKFLLKIVALPEGGGPKFLQKLQKSGQKFLEGFLQWICCLKFQKSEKSISAIFAGISAPPPLWKSQKFKKKFRFLGRSTSDFSLNWEEFLSFDTLFMAFSKRHFFELSVIFLGRIPPISLPEVEHFLCKIRTFSAIRWLDKRPNGRP